MAAIVRPSPLDRRRRLRTGAVAGTPLARAFQALQEVRRAECAPAAEPLVPVADDNTGLPVLRLPPGCNYRTFGWTGDVMADGTLTPGCHAGMGLVASRWIRGRGFELTLMRGHGRCVSDPDEPLPAVGHLDERSSTAPCYDRYAIPGRFCGVAGGTTAVTFRRGRFEDSRATLGGLLSAGAGTATPWGSWLAAERQTALGSRIAARDHGFVFEVPAPHVGPASAVPIEDMGLMRHGAAAVDPASSAVYLGEDNGPASGFYRYRPYDARQRLGALATGGRLEMLKVIGEWRADLREPRTGDSHAVEWVPIERPTAPPEVLGSPAPGLPPIEGRGKSGPFVQGEAAGAAVFGRPTRVRYHDHVVYLVDRGATGIAAVWALELPEDEICGQGRLTAIFVSPGDDGHARLDELVIGPRGDLVACERSPRGAGDTGDSRAARLVGVGPTGEARVLAENALAIDRPLEDKPLIQADDYRAVPFRGATFSPDGAHLFVNLPSPGLTLAIRMP